MKTIKNNSHNLRKSEQQWIKEWVSGWIKSDQQKIIREFSEKYPVDILGLCKALNVLVYKTYMDTSLEGWIEYNQSENCFEIYLNPQYPAVKQRYTLAHEIAHFLFHKKEIISTGQLDRGYLAKGFFDVREWQANLYASELLMPTESINEILDENPKYLAQREDFAKLLAEKFQVSGSVALKRAARAIKAIEELDFPEELI